MSRPDDPLTTPDYWDGIHHGYAPLKNKWHRRCRRWLNRGFESHYDYVLQRLLNEFMPTNGRIIEIGCAPGRRLLSFSERFGLEPHGVDYSRTGIEATIREFERHSANTDGVILGNFTDPGFRRAHAEAFDVVYSAGLIEHFDNPHDIVRYHIELLKPGGRLIISIPNLRGIYYPTLAVLGRDVLAAHNLRIMRLPEYAALFKDQKLADQYCDYVGTIQLPLMVPPRRFRPFQIVARAVQVVVDAILVNLGLERPLRRSLVSSHLLYIGTKQ